jgi:hypothetical protein
MNVETQLGHNVVYRFLLLIKRNPFGSCVIQKMFFYSHGVEDGVPLGTVSDHSFDFRKVRGDILSLNFYVAAGCLNFAR